MYSRMASPEDFPPQPNDGLPESPTVAEVEAGTEEEQKLRERIEQYKRGFITSFDGFIGKSSSLSDLRDFQTIAREILAKQLMDTELREMAEGEGKALEDLTLEEQAHYLGQLESNARQLRNIEDTHALRGNERFYSPISQYVMKIENPALAEAMKPTGLAFNLPNNRLVGEMHFIRLLLTRYYPGSTVDNWPTILRASAGDRSQPAYSEQGAFSEAAKDFLAPHTDLLAVIREMVHLSGSGELAALTSERPIPGNHVYRGDGHDPYHTFFTKLEEAGITADPDSPAIQEIREAFYIQLQEIRARKVRGIQRRLETLDNAEMRTKLRAELDSVQEEIEWRQREMQRLNSEIEDADHTFQRAGKLSFLKRGNAAQQLAALRANVDELKREIEEQNIWQEAAQATLMDIPSQPHITRGGNGEDDQRDELEEQLSHFENIQIPNAENEQ
jgi:hypothetical protein